MLRKIPGFISLGHASVFATYIAIMAILLVTNMDWSSALNVGRRAGWLAASNIALLAFLGLKNTPLAFLTAYPYERINILHQLAGYTTVTCMLVHGTTELSMFSLGGSLEAFTETENFCGVIAGCAMLVMLVTAVFIRRISYELFYVLHIAMFMLILITVCLHRPDVTTHTMIIILVAAGIWFSDRTIHATRLMYNSYHGHVIVMPLSENGIRVVFAKSTLLGRAKPGSHVFFWIPRIRLLETHPFTLASTNPMELVISAHDGFTRDLLTYARNHPGAKLRASIDGPYGTVPKFSAFDQVILIAGGNGATFAFGVALDLVRKLSRHPQNVKPVLNLIWAVRERGKIHLFSIAFPSQSNMVSIPAANGIII
jgi:predicted ferric reductase